jgi:hypothetical protein
MRTPSPQGEAVGEPLDTHHRALRLNLDEQIFGTFAEIGAGQEVARWFLQAGGAAGTVAKTMSAYDMKFSDDIYGEGTRYVSRERLLAMLDHEYRLLMQRLGERRGANTSFFVFADTVSARSYAGTNECHGWLGVRFQPAPGAEPSQVLLHVNLRDPTNLRQQQALGILGVNLLYGAYYDRASQEELLAAIFASLTLERVEVDVVELIGPAFTDPDPIRLGDRLVRTGMAQAVMFDECGRQVQPSSAVRKRPVVIQRVMFHSVTAPHRDMLGQATDLLVRKARPERDPLSTPELTVRPVAGREAPDPAETRRRLQAMFESGQPALLTRFPQLYRLTEYLRRYTPEAIRFVVGSSTMVQIMRKARYEQLMGGLLEALGRLLAEDVKLYVCSMPAEAFWRELEAAEVEPAFVRAPREGDVTADAIELDAPVGHLYRYLLEAGWLVSLTPPA